MQAPVEHDRRPRLAITLGDPAGIGPELVAKLLSNANNLERAELKVIGTGSELSLAAAEAGLPGGGDLSSVEMVAPAIAGAYERGAPSRAAGERCTADLRKALELHRNGEVDAIMFAPMNKTSLRMAGMHQEDELRWFAEELGYGGRTSELNVVDGLWTARVTSHIPVSEIAEHITASAVTATVELLSTTLAMAGRGRCRIAVCALNPHAGENGNFGRQEIDEIAPGVEAARRQGLDASGPFPSDTLFRRAMSGEFDGVVTMYHDQGQIALKTVGFDRGVTLHGGLPVLIGTPSSGTAFDIVGKGVANPGAAQMAFELLCALASSHSRHAAVPTGTGR